MRRGKSEDVFLEKLKTFMNTAKNLNGVELDGSYTISIETFIIAFEEYLKTGNKELDTHTEMTYIAMDARESGVYGQAIWNKNKREKVKELLNNKGFWNIDYWWSKKDKENIKWRLRFSENYFSERETARRRRQEATAYTSNKKIRKLIFSRDGKFCKECGAIKNLTLDHITPVSCGGVDELSNLQVLCRSCNSKKGNNHQVV